MKSDSSYSDTTIKAIKVGFIAIGMYAVFSHLWACEDAYISFRYVENFIRGYGLVYNIGDRVEGFTHPLWLFLITLPTALGLSVRAAALVISLALTLAALILVALLDKDKTGKEIAIPFGLVLLITHTGFRDFSVSGLEFPLTCFLMVLFYQSYKRHDLLAKPVFHGTLLALVYLTRPELALLIISFYAVLLFQSLACLKSTSTKALRTHLTAIIWLSLPIAVIAGGYHVFRLAYYGEVFPNTYYAKDGGGAYWSQGWVYFLHFWRYSPILLASVMTALVGMIVSPRWRQWLAGDTPRRVMLMQAVMLMIYITRLGGDFMAYRFFLPVMVILAVWLNDLVNLITESRRTRYLAGAALLAGTIALAFIPITAPKRVGFIADERQYYDLYQPAYRALFEEPVAQPWYKAGLDLKALQEKTNYPISLGAGNIGYLGYAAGAKINIVDVYGLVDRQTGRNWQMVHERGRPGHDKKLSLRMAMDRRVTICETPFTAWNKVMDTPFGPIITLDPAFLKFYPEKAAGLKELKKMLVSGTVRGGELPVFIQLLEQAYGVRLEDL